MISDVLLVVVGLVIRILSLLIVFLIFENDWCGGIVRLGIMSCDFGFLVVFCCGEGLGWWFGFWWGLDFVLGINEFLLVYDEVVREFFCDGELLMMEVGFEIFWRIGVIGGMCLCSILLLSMEDDSDVGLWGLGVGEDLVVWEDWDVKLRFFFGCGYFLILWGWLSCWELVELSVVLVVMKYDSWGEGGMVERLGWVSWLLRVLVLGLEERGCMVGGYFWIDYVMMMIDLCFCCWCEIRWKMGGLVVYICIVMDGKEEEGSERRGGEMEIGIKLWWWWWWWYGVYGSV